MKMPLTLEKTIVDPFESPRGSTVHVTLQKNQLLAFTSVRPTAKLRMYEDGEFVAESDMLLESDGGYPDNYNEIVDIFTEHICLTFLFED